jgi:hypothetical protein
LRHSAGAGAGADVGRGPPVVGGVVGTR